MERNRNDIWESFSDSEFTPDADGASVESGTNSPDMVDCSGSNVSQDDALDLECENRFEVAMCYRTLLKGVLFNEKTEAALMVECEAKEFFRGRLEVLMGIRSPNTTNSGSPFTEIEIVALKAIAKKITDKPKFLESGPTINKASVHSPRSLPTLKNASVLQKTKTSVIKQDSKKKFPDVTIIQTEKSLINNGFVEDTGKIVKEGHKRYRVVKNDKGTEFKQDITGQGNPVGRVPMPSGAALEQITASQAAISASHLSNTLPGVGSNLGVLINQQINQGEGDEYAR